MKKTIFFAAILTSFLFTSCEKETYGNSTSHPSTTSTSSSGSSSSKCSSVQCFATAKSTGTRCRNKTTNCNGRCYQHQ